MAGHDDHDAVAWRVERACAAAWPARNRAMVGDWVMALSGGGTRRVNSASAACATRLDIATLSAIEAHYAAAAQPSILRLTSLHPDPSILLDGAGYAPAEGRTATLMCDLTSLPAHDSAVSLEDMPSPRWLAARRRLSHASGAGDDDHVAPIARLSIPAAFAALTQGDRIVSLAFAALHDDIAVVEAVATDPGTRRRGFAARVVTALLHWARARRSEGAALQVQQANHGARALYHGLGFDRHLYDYHYRRRMPCPISG